MSGKYTRFRKIDHFDRQSALGYAQTVQSSTNYLKMYIEQLVIYINRMTDTINGIIDYLNKQDMENKQLSSEIKKLKNLLDKERLKNRL